MAHHDGTIAADELYPVAEACGQTADQVRSCLRRLVAEGLFAHDGEGRSAVFRASPQGMRLGSSLERTRLAYAQDAAGRGWDRKWRLIAFAIPETRRTATSVPGPLARVGGAAIQNGLYVSPHRWEKDAIAEAQRLGLEEHVTFASTDDLEIAGVRDPKEIAARLWPIDQLATRYQSFVQIYEGIPEALERMRKEKRRLSEAEFLPGALIIGIKFQECFYCGSVAATRAPATTVARTRRARPARSQPASRHPPARGAQQASAVRPLRRHPRNDCVTPREAASDEVRPFL